MFSKYSKTAIATLMALALFVFVGMATAFAATPSEASANSNTIPKTDSAADNVATSTKVFEGYTVAVLDKTIAAVNIYSGDTSTTRETMYFRSATGKELGSITRKDYLAIVKKNEKVVSLPGGGTYGAPPVDGKSWEAWFADEFNKYRGLDAGSRQEAVNEFNTNGKYLSDFQTDIVSLTNEEREKAGLPILTVDSELTELAQVRAEELLLSESHVRPDGTKVTDLGYGENCHYTATTPSGAMQNWMGSVGHKRNILLEEYTRIGVGCYSVGGRIYWVQIFAFDSSWY